jgi:hypothetical protein
VSAWRNALVSSLAKILILPVIVANLYAIDTPTEPAPPSMPFEDSKGTKKKEAKKDVKPKKANVQVKLCDGREVSGSIEYTKEEIALSHSKDGIKYEKKIEISELRQITINSWEAVKQKKIKEGTTFNLNPSDVTITLKDGESFVIQGLKQTEFLTLSLKNRNGTAYLFSYWMDLQFENGKWHSKIPISKSGIREECHPDIWRTLKFYSIELE